MRRIEFKLDFIPVEERLPEENNNVYVLGLSDLISECFRQDGCWYFTDEMDGDDPCEPTHWAERPEIKEASREAEMKKICSTCKWWARYYPEGADGKCEESVRVTFSDPGEDFGCVLWESGDTDSDRRQR